MRPFFMAAFLSSSYRRQKKIDEIKAIMMRRQDPFAYRRKTVIFTNDTWLKFLMVLGFMIVGSIFIPHVIKIFSSPLPKFSIALSFFLNLANGWLAVEITDYLYLKYIREIDWFFNYGTIILGVVVLGGLLYISKNYFSLESQFIQWRDKINTDLASKPFQVLLQPAQGKNWNLVDYRGVYLFPQPVEVLPKACLQFGVKWVPWDGRKNFIFNPSFKSNRPFYVWQRSGTGGIGVQIEKDGQIGKAFVSANQTSRYAVLCIDGTSL